MTDTLESRAREAVERWLDADSSHERQIAGELRALLTAFAKAEREQALEEAKQACLRQQQDFRSNEYALNQPISSISERFACGQCAEAIDALKGGDA